jgi:hypothetical protein
MRPRFSAIVLMFLLIATTVGANESPCAKVQAQLRTIVSAVELYNAKHGAYPEQQGWMAALKGAGILSRDFPEKDHWGNPFFYRTVGAAFDLRSIGPDRRWSSDDDQVKVDGWRWTTCKVSGC